jgi:hydroxypyruvate reductase
MQGALDVLGSRLRDAVIVTKDAGGVTLPWPVIESGHPLPDARSLAAGDRVLEFAGSLPSEAHVLVLLSGGASALVEKLAAGIDLATLQRITHWMLAAGLDIATMNRIRKRLSLIKGGRLAQRLYPRRTLCLAISDVPGDDPRAIGSGPLVAEGGEESIPAEAPAFVREALRLAAPLPAPGDACFGAVQLRIIATLTDAKRGAAEAAVRHGYAAVTEPEFVSSDALAAGPRVAERLLLAAPSVIHIWGGETTVRLPEHPGRGGRNQSLALSAALRLEGTDVALLAAGTDGTDGPTEDAGALVDGGTVGRGAEQGLDARAALAAADAGTFLEAAGDLIHTGPTGTNVMDLIIGMRLA